jgi:hypothetical protein
MNQILFAISLLAVSLAHAEPAPGLVGLNPILGAVNGFSFQQNGPPLFNFKDWKQESNKQFTTYTSGAGFDLRPMNIVKIEKDTSGKIAAVRGENNNFETRRWIAKLNDANIESFTECVAPQAHGFGNYCATTTFNICSHIKTLMTQDYGDLHAIQEMNNKCAKFNNDLLNLFASDDKARTLAAKDIATLKSETPALAKVENPLLLGSEGSTGEESKRRGYNASLQGAFASMVHSCENIAFSDPSTPKGQEKDPAVK